MQTTKLLCPSTDFDSGRPGSGECGMLILLHDLLLSYEVSERYIHLYRVSHLKAKFMKLFSCLLKGIMVQLIKCDCSGLVCTPGCFPGGSHLFAAPRSDLATSYWKAQCQLGLAVHEENGSRVTLCGYTWCPGRWKPPHFCLECRWRACVNPTSDPACRIFPSLVQVPPGVGPSSCARLVVCRWDQQRTTDSPHHVPALADGSRGRCKEHAASGGQAIPLEGIGLLAFLCCHTRRYHGGRPSKRAVAPLHRHTEEGMPL
jgi:hypothetical protein